MFCLFAPGRCLTKQDLLSAQACKLEAKNALCSLRRTSSKWAKLLHQGIQDPNHPNGISKPSSPPNQSSFLYSIILGVRKPNFSWPPKLHSNFEERLNRYRFDPFCEPPCSASTIFRFGIIEKNPIPQWDRLFIYRRRNSVLWQEVRYFHWRFELRHVWFSKYWQVAYCGISFFIPCLTPFGC